MMQITRAEIIAVTLLIHQSLDRSARFEFCNQAVSLVPGTDHNQPGSEAQDIAATGRLPDGYHHDQS